MAYKWRKSVLSNEVDILLGFAFKSADFATEPPGYRLVRGDNVKRSTIEWGEKTRYWRNFTPELERYLLRPCDIVIGMDGSRVGENFATITEGDLPALLVQRVACLRARQDLDQGFLRYLICNPNFTAYIKAVQTGTSIPHISGGQIGSYPISMPPLSQQRAIAHILGTLDDKIDLNRRMNVTLEAMAHALFKSWFVDFDPVRAKAEGRDPGLPPEIADLFPDRFVESELGEIPEGWEVAKFTDTIEIMGGGTPKTSVSEYWDGDIPWFSVVDAPTESAIWVIDTEKKVTRIGLENSTTRLLPVGTTIISARGTVGRLALVGVPMAMNQSCYGLRGRMGANGYFNYFAIREIVVQLQMRAHGSVFDTITRDTLASVNVVVPPAKLIEAFEQKVGPCLERIRKGVFAAHSLANMRDTLLPKLISGELPVTDADLIVSGVTA